MRIPNNANLILHKEIYRASMLINFEMIISNVIHTKPIICYVSRSKHIFRVSSISTISRIAFIQSK